MVGGWWLVVRCWLVIVVVCLLLVVAFVWLPVRFLQQGRAFVSFVSLWVMFC